MAAPTGVGGADSEVVESISQMFATWDFGPAFDYAYTYSNPATPYPGDKTIEIIAGGWPWQTIVQLETLQNSLMTRPIMGIISIPSKSGFTYLGDAYVPDIPGTPKFARRKQMRLIVAVWADQQLGGGDLVRALGGQIEGCVLYNSNRLSNIRNLQFLDGHTEMETSEIWRYDCLVSGNGVISIEGS